MDWRDGSVCKELTVEDEDLSLLGFLAPIHIKKAGDRGACWETQGRGGRSLMGPGQPI